MAKVDWPVNEALKHVIEAVLAFREIHGAQNLRSFLLQELTREICIGEIADRNRRLVVAASNAAEEARARQIETALKALEFYGDSDNYNRPARNTASPITADKGRIARDAIEAITPDEPSSE